MRQNSQFATSWIFQAGSCFQGFNFSTSQNTETKNMSMVSWNKSICDALESMELGQKPLTKSKLPSLELWDCFEKHTQGLWAAVPNPTMQILTVFLLDLYSPLPTVIHIGIRGWGQSPAHWKDFPILLTFRAITEWECSGAFSAPNSLL